MRTNHPETPDLQAIGAGRGGNIPPVGTRWQPGRSGNPKGRPPSAGKSIVEALNQLVADDVLEDELRKLARGRRVAPVKRIAAGLLLQALEHGDLADFDGLIFGEAQLEELRAIGIDTAVVKRFTRRIHTKIRRDGTVEKDVSVTIELHDRSGRAFDRIMDRTLGRATHRISLHEPEPANARLQDGAEAVARLMAMLDPNVPPRTN
jgi:hypothetical protein